MLVLIPSKTCEYCGSPAKLVKGDVIYPHRPDLFGLNFWLCSKCNAYVGCHKRNDKFNITGFEPLGRLANLDLRVAKASAHRAFDPIWKSGRKSRTNAYRMLARTLDIAPEKCHIGNFDLDRCKAVVKLCQM